MNPLAQALLDTFGNTVIRTGADARAPFERDWRGRTTASALAVAVPADVATVQALLRWCAQQRVAVIPQGGNTGLCGGSVPHPGIERPQLILSVQKLRAVREVDAQNDTLTVEAGLTLLEVQAVAASHERLFPLSLASEGSCCIGGNIATNAGGVQVLRYGNTRALVLGLEVVLPDGSLWQGLRGLRKDNTGYDLKQMFIGSEGTLGVITAATLRLFPIPQQQQLAWVGLPSPAAAVELFHLLRARCGDRISSYELIGRAPLELALRHIPGTRDPLPDVHPWQVLVQIDDIGFEGFTEQLAGLAGSAGFTQAVIAQNQTQHRALWALREHLSEAQRIEGISVKHDIALPISQLAAFIEEASAALERLCPATRVVCFGHLGDGNLHYNLFLPGLPAGSAEWHAMAVHLTRTLHDLVAARDGSFSAEHGIGQFKVAELVRYRSAVEVQLMRGLKQAWDPQNLLNPGKVIDPAGIGLPATEILPGGAATASTKP